MTTMRWSDHVQKGLASARPAASTVAVGALYASTDTGVIEQSDGTTWSTYASTGVTTLDGLSDVDTTTTAPTTGDVLAFDGTEWAPTAPASGGAAALDDLTDVDTTTTAPTDGQPLVWNATATQWEPASLSASQVTRTTNTQTGTTYTLVLGDASKFVTLSNASAITLTVPPNSSVAFPVGTELILAQIGAGQVTIAPGSGVTLNSTPGLKIAAQYGTAALKKTATDTWLVFGRLSA